MVIIWHSPPLIKQTNIQRRIIGIPKMNKKTVDEVLSKVTLVISVVCKQDTCLLHSRTNMIVARTALRWWLELPGMLVSYGTGDIFGNRGTKNE